MGVQVISTRSILKGAFGRFLPTCAFLLEVDTYRCWHPAWTWTHGHLCAFYCTRQAQPWATEILSGMRRHLSADAPVAGRPSITAGVVAPIVIMLALMVGPHPGNRLIEMALSAIGGGSLSLVMFFAWLSKPSAVGRESLEIDGLAKPDSLKQNARRWVHAHLETS